MMQVYLPDINPRLRTTLKQFNWITDLEAHHLYLRDLNQAYNKMDIFVVKQALIQTPNGQEVAQSQGNIMDLSALPV
jgi:predicted HNH restriction endonuclease